MYYFKNILNGSVMELGDEIVEIYSKPFAVYSSFVKIIGFDDYSIEFSVSMRDKKSRNVNINFEVKMTFEDQFIVYVSKAILDLNFLEFEENPEVYKFDVKDFKCLFNPKLFIGELVIKFFEKLKSEDNESIITTDYKNYYHIDNVDIYNENLFEKITEKDFKNALIKNNFE